MNKENIFTSNTRLFVIIPVVIIVAAILLSIFGLGMNIGIDFAGGSLLKYEVGEQFEVSVVEEALAAAGITDGQIAKTGSEQTTLEVRTKSLGDGSEDLRITFEEKLAETYTGLDFITLDTVGATAGRDLIANAVKSCLIVFVCLLIYIAIRFDLYSGVTALIALCHDVLVMCAFMVFTRGFFQVNSSFIAAVLTIIGYSINNTIIIFDRVRENSKLLQYKGASSKPLVEASVRQTFARTMNTTITTLLTLVVLYICGVSAIREFVFPLIVGMLAGVYSSVFLSSQMWANLFDKKVFAPITNLFKGKKATKKA